MWHVAKTTAWQTLDATRPSLVSACAQTTQYGANAPVWAIVCRPLISQIKNEKHI